MISIQTLTQWLAWSTTINLGILVFASLMIVLMRGWATRLHANMFDLPEEAVRLEYYRYLANYKIAIFIFNLVPYLALRIIA